MYITTYLKMPAEEELVQATKFNEPIKIIDINEAWNMLDVLYESLSTSYLNALHLQILHDILQRNTLATHILITPNIVAELFTLEEAQQHRDYITRRLIGTQIKNDHLVKDKDTLWRQTYRLMLKIHNKNVPQLYFFYHGQVNSLVQDLDCWHFHTSSPLYKTLHKVFRFFERLPHV